MTPELWQRLKPLYDGALDLPEQERTDYIAQMCGADRELASELSALLSADGSAAHTLDPLDPLFGDISLFLPSRPVKLEPGTLLVNRFRIVRHLGSGGMGDVYEAVDTQLEQGRIALKTIRPDIAGNAAALARFKDEVLLARKITGPNVCRIHELYLASEDHREHSTAFLTMELLEGATLYDRIENGSALEVSEIRRITEQLCAALGCIHEAGIVHRDLKPRNIMLVPHAGSEKVVVMDFGLARATVQPAGYSGASLAAPGVIAGTPSYMAPEQFEGGEVGPPTDIYALGLILYEMATSLQPFAAHTPLAAAIRRSRRPQSASSVRADLPPVWDDVIKRCLEYDPPLRYQTTEEVLHAIHHPGKVMLRLGPNRRIVFPRTGLISTLLLLLALASAGAWRYVSNARERKLAPEAAHWYELGMTALREGSYLKATRLLAEVTNRDPTYALAHAALADAWTELDFTNAAQREMLLASSPAEQRGLTDMDRRYIDAVRNTLVRDYSAAAQDYEAILNKLPDGSKAQGYVDLGRIYEKAGKVPETVASYEKAAELNPDDPAPFLHLGILKSRLREPEAAKKDFDHAEALYSAESDQEGLAEVAYQRGYAANEAGKFPQATESLEEALAVARQIPSPQMQARTLSQLSTVTFLQGHDEQALAMATQAKQIAQENGLEYWATDALLRMGNVYMHKEDFPAAEPPLREALLRAQENGHPRLEASAQLTLASLCNLLGRRDEQIHFAQSALTYYQDYGFLDSADKALILLARGQRDKGNYAEALAAGNKLLETAARTHSAQFTSIGEELVGTVYLRLERYPDALNYFQKAMDTTVALGRNPAYQQDYCAVALWRLGRFNEARAILAAISPEMRQRNDLSGSIAVTEANLELSEGQDHAALKILDQLPRPAAGTVEDDPDVLAIRLEAELEGGELGPAQRTAEQLLAAARTGGDPGVLEQAQMLYARLTLAAGDSLRASSLAEDAQRFFAAKGLLESQALSLLLQAQAAKARNDTAAAVALSQKSLDIFKAMQQSWGDLTFQQYLSRPDRHKDLRAIAALRGATGGSPDALFR